MNTNKHESGKRYSEIIGYQWILFCVSVLGLLGIIIQAHIFLAKTANPVPEAKGPVFQYVGQCSVDGKHWETLRVTNVVVLETKCGFPDVHWVESGK